MAKVTPTRLKAYVSEQMEELATAYRILDSLIPYDPDSPISQTVAGGMSLIQAKQHWLESLYETFREDGEDSKDNSEPKEPKQPKLETKEEEKPEEFGKTIGDVLDVD